MSRSKLLAALLAGSALLLLDGATAGAQTASELTRAGRQALGRRSYEDLQAALEHFGAALALEPGHAPAWAGRAEARALLGDYPSAERAAQKALELDDGLATAHATLGFVRLHARWDWAGAEASFRSALALDPGDPLAHHWFAILLEAMGRHDEAIAGQRRALELEPGSLAYALGLGYRLFWARRYDEARAQLEGLLASDPTLRMAHYFLGRCYAEQGRFDLARAALESARRLAPRDLNVRAALGYLDARSGRPGAARETLAELEQFSRRGYPLSTQIASIHAALGDPEPALRRLRDALEAHEGPLVWLKVDPRFDPLRSEPALEELLGAMGLP